MTGFAKIHQSESHGQILITKEYEADDEEYKITLWVELKKMLFKVSFSSPVEESATELFTNLTLEESETIINNLLKTLS